MWLARGGELEFEREKGKFYQAEIVDEIPIENIASFGRFNLDFLCFPFAMSKPKQRDFIIKAQGQSFDVVAEGTAPMPLKISITNTGTTPITNIKVSHKKEV